MIENELFTWRTKGKLLVKAAKQMDGNKNEVIAILANATGVAELYVDPNYDYLIYNIEVLDRTGANPFLYNQRRIRLQITNYNTHEDLCRNPIDISLFSGDSERQNVYPLPILMPGKTRHIITIYNDTADAISVRVVYTGNQIMNYL
ncbi:MAG: hypothetical protein ABII90_03640 [Bacteroidota bacterium]